MKKIYLIVLAAIFSFNAHAYIDWDEIALTERDINHPNAYLVQKAVTIFNKPYTVMINNVTLSPTWFHCNIIIEKVWTDNDYLVEQSCDNEDPIADPETGKTSSLDVSLDRGYDLLIDSWMHLLETTESGRVKVKYRIYDLDKQNAFDLIISFPYNNATTGVNKVKCDDTMYYYNLEGHKSTTPFRGVNILPNGKKILY